MDETYKKRVQFEAELHHWKNQCQQLTKVIQAEKYHNQIELAKKKQRLELETEAKLELFKQQAQRDAERSTINILTKLNSRYPGH